MNTCSECIHYEICDEWSPYYLSDKAKKCEHFKSRSRFVELPCLQDSVCTHICKAEGLVNSFSIFAKILESDGETVTIDRFQKFGALHIGAITISQADFERYYAPVTEAERKLREKMEEIK